MKNKIKVLELFAGIGAPRKALTNLGIEAEYEAVEIDKNAVKTYNAIHGANEAPKSVVDYEPLMKDIDLLFHGSPCQDFSTAGKMRGGEDGSGTRSSLMWETVRIVKNNKPKIVIWENVKGVLSEKNKEVFEKYLNTLEELGYTNSYKVLNAKNFGVPTNRQRIFVVSILNGEKFDFDKVKEQALDKDAMEKIIENNYFSDIPGEYFDVFGNSTNFVSIGGKSGNITNHSFNRYWKIDAPYVGTQNIFSVLGITKLDENGKPLFCRKLLPNEALKLSGFNDTDYAKAVSAGVTNNQLFKQAGNSIVVNVLEAIFKNLFEVE